MSHSDLTRFLRALSSEPLAVERRTLDAFVGILRRRGLEGVSFNGMELHAELEVAMPRQARQTGGDAKVRVIPLVGAIANRAQSMGMGATEFAAAVRDAADDPRVSGIVLDVDSPGGTVTGVPEAAEAVFSVRGQKPITAYVSGMMASAGYWIGAAADEIIATKSSETGSIGVFATHEDWSAALEAEGVVITEIAAGKYKTEGAPWKPLDAEADEFLRTRVAEVYGWFVDDVARFRGDTAANVRKGYGEGRVLGARQAKAAGLIDRVGTMDDAIASVVKRAGASRGARAAMATGAEVVARKTARRG